MTQKTKHTPWIMEYGSEESSIIDARGYIICTNGEDPSVASDDEMAHIVKCVNMHDELVEVLQWIADNSMCEGAIFASNEALEKAGAL